MYKVIIVDDEPRTRQGLITLIPWTSYGFEVIDTAENGFEALQKYEVATPDLMIVDMKMPGMSGIELIEKIRAIDNSVHFIILSGHAEFEYAKKAISYRVTGYLLKPIDEDELMLYLEELKTKLDQEKELSKLKVRVNEEKNIQFIQAALSGDTSDQVQNYFNHLLNWKKYEVFLIAITDLHSNEKGKIIDELNDMFEEKNIGIAFEMHDYIGVLLNGEQPFAQNYEVLYAHVEKVCNDHHVHFTAAISKTMNRFVELPDAYHSVDRLIKNQFFYDTGLILHEDLPTLLEVEKKDSENRESYELKNGVEKVLFAIEVDDMDAVEQICTDLVKQMISNNETEEEIKKNMIQLLSSLFNELMYKNQETRSVISSLLPQVIEIEHQPTVNQMIAYILSLLAKILECIDFESTDNIVKKMIHLIETNYHKNLKLDTFSEVFFYNRAYLGKLFKDYTGEHFNTYLDKVRIENGKALLIQGLKVYEVAEKIGYSNVDYFHSKFRKYVGMSPSQYKKNYK